jgi:hypothetical protein
MKCGIINATSKENKMTDTKSMMDFTSMMDPTKMMDFTKIMDPKGMMAPKKMLKQMVGFNKTVFENSFKGIAMFQEQIEKITKTMIDKATWLPDEGKKALDGWSETYKSAYDSFKTAVDDNFKKLDEYLSESPEPVVTETKAAPAEPPKPVAKKKAAPA